MILASLEVEQVNYGIKKKKSEMEFEPWAANDGIELGRIGLTYNTFRTLQNDLGISVVSRSDLAG